RGGPTILKANRQSCISVMGRDNCLLKGSVRIALDRRKETRTKHRSRRSGQQGFANALPIADSARSNHRFLFGLGQDAWQGFVQPSGSLHMATCFRALADQIISAEI